MVCPKPLLQFIYLTQNWNVLIAKIELMTRNQEKKQYHILCHHIDLCIRKYFIILK